MLKNVKKQIVSVAKNEEGAALVEYGMLVGLIAVVCIGAVTTLGSTISTGFGTLATALGNAFTPA